MAARYGGAGLRSVVAVSSSAFVGRCSQALPLFVNVAKAGGAVRPGALPGLARVLEADSFGSRKEPTRFAALFAPDTRLGMELGMARAMIQIGLVGGLSVLLSVPVTGAGWNGIQGSGVVAKLQYELTTEIESAAVTMLHLEFQALPHADLRRTAIASVDRASSLFLIAFPSRGVSRSRTRSGAGAPLCTSTPRAWRAHSSSTFRCVANGATRSGVSTATVARCYRTGTSSTSTRAAPPLAPRHRALEGPRPAHHGGPRRL